LFELYPHGPLEHGGEEEWIVIKEIPEEPSAHGVYDMILIFNYEKCEVISVLKV
jgi:hypothetical protein